MTDAPNVHSLARLVTVAEVFDIDQYTGFMASEPPLSRLPQPWEVWEILLDEAVESRLQVGDKLGLSDEERHISKRWRDKVRAVRNSLRPTKRNIIPHSWPTVTHVICL